MNRQLDPEILKHSTSLTPARLLSICGIPSPSTSTLLRSLMICILVKWKFVHFHGQKTCRLDRYQSIYKDSGHKRTKPFRLLSGIFFFTPDVHLRELKKVWADRIVIEEVWKNFMQKLISEWMEFVLYVSCVSPFLRLKRNPTLTSQN
jgi:hypothetical protein